MYLYFSLQSGSVNTPFSGMWQTTAGATRFILKSIKNKDAITAGSTINGGAAAGSIYLDRQYISEPLAYPQLINGQISGQLMVRELAGTDNVDRVFVCGKVVSKDGSVIRGTILPSGNYGPTLEFIANATHRNKTIITNQALTSVQALQGDRLVFEIGYSNSTAGTTPQASAKWGMNAPRLPVNETQTTDGAGWLQITPDLEFARTMFVAMDGC